MLWCHDDVVDDEGLKIAMRALAIIEFTFAFKGTLLIVFVISVYVLVVPEMVDDGECLSDSTSEERSLSSYTSESFDDNGRNECLKQICVVHNAGVF